MKHAILALFFLFGFSQTHSLVAQQPNWPSTGQTVAPVRDTDSLFLHLPLGQLADLGSLLPPSGGEPRYLALGGALTAGFRRGGLTRDAQLTAYPHLIARQMGLHDFHLPLFSPDQGNGTGYLLLTEMLPFPRYQVVTNQTAIITTQPLTYTPFEGPCHNLGLPFLGVNTALSTEPWRFDASLAPGTPYEPAFRPFFRRLLPSTNQQWLTAYVPFILQKPMDLCTIELGLDDAITYAAAGAQQLSGAMSQLDMGEGSALIALLTHLQRTAIKGVVATVPDVLSFPYFRFYTPQQVRVRNASQALYAVVDDRYLLAEDKTAYVQLVDDADILLPTERVHSLAVSTDREAKFGLSIDKPLSSQDVLSATEREAMRGVAGLNNLIRTQAERFGIPVVDLEAIYHQILAGNYVTDDGLRIDPSFPSGNFFSIDGLYPTALGQAVIANEWIKVFNRHYGSRIPLINTHEFAKHVKE